MTKRTIGMLDGELRDAGDAELCITGTSDTYGSLDRMLIESADCHVEHKDIVVGCNVFTDEPVYEHRLVKVVARRDPEMVKVEWDADGLDEDERQVRLARAEGYEDAMDHVSMSVDDMEMDRQDENDVLEDMMNYAPGCKWDLLREEGTDVRYEDGQMVVEEHVFSAPVFPYRAHRRPVKGVVRNLEKAIESGRITQGQLYTAIAKANPLATCATSAKKAIAQDPACREFWANRYRNLRRCGAKDTIPSKAVSHLWELIKTRDFLKSR